MTLAVNRARLQKTLEEVSQIGTDPSKGAGLFRLSFSENDLKGREYLMQHMRENGLDVFVDGAFNIHGRINWPEGMEKPTSELPAVVTGSHNDSVPAGGTLDGSLGVLVGIECLIRIKELGLPLNRPMEVIDFTDEEGRFGGMLGSMCLAGLLTVEKITNMIAADGLKCTDALASVDRTPVTAVDSAYFPQSIHSYVELHIEQGPVLDTTKEEIGIVTAIVGLWKAEFTLTGQANHAGTTPMNLRQNAFLGCAKMQVELENLLKEYGSENSVATIGKVDVFPGGANVVPARCIFTLEMRDSSAEVLDRLHIKAVETLTDICKEINVGMDCRVMSNIEAVVCDDRIVSCIDTVCKDLDITKYRHMPSGAAHDAQNIPAIGPMGMIFVPSVNGISHDPKEYTHIDDIFRGADVLLNSLYRLDRELDTNCIHSIVQFLS